MTFMSIRCSCSPITTVLHNRLSSRSSSAVYSGIDSDSWPESLLDVEPSGSEAQRRTEEQDSTVEAVQRAISWQSQPEGTPCLTQLLQS